MRKFFLSGAFGAAMVLASGTAMADWQSAYERAQAYHDDFDKTYLGYDGETAMAAQLQGMDLACSVKYSYAGFGGSIEVETVTAEPDNNMTQGLCGQAQQQAAMIAQGGISFSGDDLRQLGTIVADKTPTLVDSSKSAETYAIVITSDQMPNLQNVPPGVSITLSISFAKSNGSMRGFSIESTPFPIPQMPGGVMSVHAASLMGYTADGRPHLGEGGWRAKVTDTEGQGRDFAMAAVNTFTNVTEVTPTASVSGTKAPATGFVNLEMKGVKGEVGLNIAERLIDGISDVAGRANEEIDTMAAKAAKPE